MYSSTAAQLPQAVCTSCTLELHLQATRRKVSDAANPTYLPPQPLDLSVLPANVAASLQDIWIIKVCGGGQLLVYASILEHHAYQATAAVDAPILAHLQTSASAMRVQQTHWRMHICSMNDDVQLDLAMGLM